MLSMRAKDWDRLFEDHPEVGWSTTDMSKYWMYDPLSVALARCAALLRRDLIHPIVAWPTAVRREFKSMWQ